MAFDIDQRYRIKRNSEQEEQMRYLVNDLKLFKSLSQLLVVSAVIGFINEKSRPFDKNAEPVLMNSFSERSYDMMNFIAYAEKKDQSVLKDGKQYQFFIFNHLGPPQGITRAALYKSPRNWRQLAWCHLVSPKNT